jgi:hopanoid biosynthesis associated protein HpnK
LKQLIVTADDFGAAREINDAVEAAHLRGILTAASLMVGGPAATDAIARARRMPSLRVGLHLVLVDGRPLLPISSVPDLVDASGHFCSNMVGSGATMFFNPYVRAQLAAEIYAQFVAFHDTGLTLDHCNAHKHFHLHPTIGRLLVQIGRRFGLQAVRVPLEPRDVLARIEPSAPPPYAWATAPWAYLLRRRLRRAGILAPNHVFGLRWSGGMTKDRLLGIIHNLPEGLSEIYVHPATCDRFAEATSAYRYAEEFAALLSPEVIAQARDPLLRLGGFMDFLKSGSGDAIARTSRHVSTDRSLPP